MKKFSEILAETPRRLDDNQIAAISCDDRNAVVSAGAGSGKTTVLSYRFLRLVVEGKAHVDEILTLTFTRKAAAEMHERIHRQLLAYRKDPDIAGELARFPDAAISTLDSFCSRIVRCDCVRYGISPDYVTDDETCRRLAALCATQTLEEQAEDPATVFLAAMYSPEALVDEFLVPYAMERFTFTDPLRAEPAADAVRSYFLRAVSESYRKLMELVRWIGTLEDLTSSPVRRAKELCARIEDLLPPLVDAGSWPEIQRMFSSESLNLNMSGSSKNKPDCVALSEIVPEYRRQLDRFHVAASALAQQDRLVPIFRFLEQFQNRFFEQKRRAGILTFSDVARMAVDILKTNPTLRRHFKNKFKYIMIDEFQDNDPIQKDLLYLLAERSEEEGEGIPSVDRLDRGKLFFVGDEKQSIYLFRGADVSVFKQLKHELGSAGGVSLSLNTNYRSEPRLIDHLNDLFKRVMNNDGQPWEADFSPLSTRMPSPGIAPSITFCFKPMHSEDAAADEPDSDDEDGGELAHASEAEAVHLADLIATMLDSDSYLIPDGAGGRRRPAPNDIAILLKSTGGQLSYEKALRAKGIPYTLQIPRALLMEAPANDLYNLLQLALYPEDRLAYVASLRSPFCRMSDTGVLAVIGKYDEAPYLGVPYPVDEGVVGELESALSASDLARYRIAAETFGNLAGQVGRVPVSRLLSYLWHDRAYRNYLVSNPSYQVYLEHYDYLWLLASQYDQRGDGLAEFLDFLRPRLGANEKLTDIELLHEDIHGVQIMTIHKSKGLEFPIVIVAGMGTKGSMERQPAFSPCGPVALPHHMEVVTAAGGKTVVNGSYYLDKDRQTNLARAELKRQLYVAATRAETHLVFSGCENARNHGEDAELSNLLYMFVRNSDLDMEHLVSNDPEISFRVIEDVRADSLYAQGATPIGDRPDAQRCVSWYRNARPRIVYDLPLRYGVTKLYGVGTGTEPLDIGSGQALPPLACDPTLKRYGLSSRFGTFVHAVADVLIEGGLPDPSLQDLSLLFPDGKPEPMSGTEFHRILSDGLSLARGFLDSDVWKELSSLENAMIECEVPFFARAEHDGREVLLEGSVDLLVTLSDRQYIVDFKTDSLRNPQAHERQVRVYMEAMHRIYGLPILGTVCFLRQPGNETWWSLDR
ncbi:MAG: UvrD-helicase domain-containing protein [Sphaerochaetaceae bacterium]|jgi:ATP-dependent exoDNAse (exonuclease V) beta subunit